MKFHTAVVLSLAGTGLAITTTSCYADNCARAVTGTIHGATRVTAAQSDCSSFLQTTITPDVVTVTATVTDSPSGSGNVGKVKRDPSSTSGPVPAYASPCSGTARYSSACSCWGITGGTTTAPASTTTVTVTSTSTSSAPTCTNTLTDTQNCGSCGHVCGANDICQNGACSTPTCQGQTCDSGFSNCGDSTNCYCFTTSGGTGFCAQNALCSGLTPCTSDSQCGTGNICATNTCCGASGVCLNGECGNPSKKLIRMAKGRRMQEDTAAGV